MVKVLKNALRIQTQNYVVYSVNILYIHTNGQSSVKESRVVSIYKMVSLSLIEADHMRASGVKQSPRVGATGRQTASLLTQYTNGKPVRTNLPIYINLCRAQDTGIVQCES